MAKDDGLPDELDPDLQQSINKVSLPDNQTQQAEESPGLLNRSKGPIHYLEDWRGDLILKPYLTASFPELYQSYQGYCLSKDVPLPKRLERQRFKAVLRCVMSLDVRWQQGRSGSLYDGVLPRQPVADAAASAQVDSMQGARDQHLGYLEVLLQSFVYREGTCAALDDFYNDNQGFRQG